MKNIIITGFMGTGKTAVGSVLAKKLEYSFVDLDDFIEEIEGKGVPEIFAEKGEAYFRQAETRALKEVLQGEARVISTGGGTLLKKENQQLLMAAGTVVCLTAPAEEILQRVGAGESRPLLEGEDPLNTIRKLLNEREDVYSKVPHKISTREKSIETVARDIINLLGMDNNI